MPRSSRWCDSGALGEIASRAPGPIEHAGQHPPERLHGTRRNERAINAELLVRVNRAVSITVSAADEA